MQKVAIYGEASKKIVKEVLIREVDLGKTILQFLEEHKMPIASSCLGEGVCKKCVINKDLLSCLSKVEDILLWKQPVISISYL